jgi:exonuclease VII small subunit
VEQAELGEQRSEAGLRDALRKLEQAEARVERLDAALQEANRTLQKIHKAQTRNTK